MDLFNACLNEIDMKTIQDCIQSSLKEGKEMLQRDKEIEEVLAAMAVDPDDLISDDDFDSDSSDEISVRAGRLFSL